MFLNVLQVTEYTKPPSISEISIEPPHVVHNEQTDGKEYIDRETGEVLPNGSPYTPQSSGGATPPKEDSSKTENVGESKDLAPTLPVENGGEDSPGKPLKLPVSPESDLRKQFFEKLLLRNSGASVISGSLDDLRRLQTDDNHLDDENNAHFDNRPRSASPTFYRNSDNKINLEKNRGTNNSLIEDNQDGISPNDNSNSKLRGHNLKLDLSSVDHQQSLETPMSETERSVTDSHLDEGSISPEKSKTRPYVDIPEFAWSPAHQRLLTELLFSVEKDLQVWKRYWKKVNIFFKIFPFQLCSP